MTRESIVVLLAIVVFFTPFLGIPDTWSQYILSHRRIEKSESERGTDSFVESNGRRDFENQEFAS